MRILIISYFFAPVGGVATERIRKFIKYLPDFGWEPIVLTQTLETYKSLKSRELDDSIIEELPDKLVIHRVSSPVLRQVDAVNKKTGFPARFAAKPQAFIHRVMAMFLLPDQHILWSKTAVNKGRKIIKSENINLILATGPSFTSFIVGAIINKLTNCPLMLDYRDPGALNSICFPRSPIRRTLNRKLERWCLSRMSAAIFATEGFRKLYVDEYPSLERRCHVISNGYDGDIVDYKPRNNISENEPVIIAYAGKMHGDQYPVRELFKAIEIFVSENGNKVIEFHMAGEISQENRKILEDARISDIVVLKGYLHKSQVDAMFSNSDALLMIIGDSHPFLYGLESAKLFECFRYSRPILALVPENGAVWQLIEKNKFGLLCPPSNIDRIVQTLQKLNHVIRNPKDDNAANTHKNRNIEQYHRRELTSQLANLCETITK